MNQFYRSETFNDHHDYYNDGNKNYDKLSPDIMDSGQFDNYNNNIADGYNLSVQQYNSYNSLHLNNATSISEQESLSNPFSFIRTVRKIKLSPWDILSRHIQKIFGIYNPTTSTTRQQPTSPTVPQADQKISNGLDVNFHFTAFIDTFKDRIRAIYPGTVWCGNGNSSRRQNDIGLFALTDYCCKVHDQCPIYINPNSENYGLKNNGLFARSHCDCDRDFYKCLKKVNTIISNKIGYTYFTILGPQCFREEYPIVSCARKVNNRCLSYLVNDNFNKTWQWFDNKFY